jgi:hypothetical protein
MAGGKKHAAATNEMNHPLWMEAHQKLVDYHKIHQHCNVTKKEDPTLARWVVRQRGERNENLTAKSRRLLDELDFQWDITRSTNQEVAWEVQFLKLQKYLDQGKPSRLADITKCDKALGDWASNQRKRYRMLRADRKKRLESIGFDFGKQRGPRKPQNLSEDQKQQWEVLFQRLLKYKEEYGHCAVPYQNKEDPELALWVSTQRREYKQKSWYGHERRMRDDRFERLLNIGFVWDNLHKKKIEEIASIVQTDSRQRSDDSRPGNNARQKVWDNLRKKGSEKDLPSNGEDEVVESVAV